MSTFPGSQRLLKCTIGGFDLLNPWASVLVFQYNLEMLTCTVTLQAAGGTRRGRSIRLCERTLPWSNQE
jgi:hypothetical protein